jgi:nicotinamidase-related amidase
MLTIAGPVILDLNTQRDLLAADGAAPVFQAEKLHEPLRKLFTFAQRNQVPVISTRFNHLVTPGHTAGTLGGARGIGENAPGKLVCLSNTPGYHKMPFTLLRKRHEWCLDCGTDLPVDGFRSTQQYIFDIPSLNLFESPRLDRLLSESSAEVFLIAGIPLEWTVRTAVLGMLARRHRVMMISDCLGMWDPYEGDMALRQVESKNVEWLTVEQVGERFSQAARLRASRAARAAARAQARMATVPPAPTKLPMKTNKGRGAFRV